eukprot:8748793-Pyramimonas_sp.AAC.1
MQQTSLWRRHPLLYPGAIGATSMIFSPRWQRRSVRWRFCTMGTTNGSDCVGSSGSVVSMPRVATARYFLGSSTATACRLPPNVNGRSLSGNISRSLRAGSKALKR